MGYSTKIGKAVDTATAYENISEAMEYHGFSMDDVREWAVELTADETRPEVQGPNEEFWAGLSPTEVDVITAFAIGVTLGDSDEPLNR